MIESIYSIAGAVLANGAGLPPIRAAGYEYVVAANGLFIRAEDSRMEAMIPVAAVGKPLHGLAAVEPYARLKLPRILHTVLRSILEDAIRRGAEEAMYQFSYCDGVWCCWLPPQDAHSAHVDYEDMPNTVVDLHSHHVMPAFFSDTDDRDEAGLRFYVVIGKIGDPYNREIRCRVGVYGHHWPVPATTIFEGAGQFVDLEARP